MKNKFKEDIFNDELIILYSKLIDKQYNSKPKALGLKYPFIYSQETSAILNKIGTITEYSIITPIEVLYKEYYEKQNQISKERDKCAICLTTFYEAELPENEDISNIFYDQFMSIEVNVIQLKKCEDHFFHIKCLSEYIKAQTSFKCPLCNKIYGVLQGNMPPGQMTVYVRKDIHCEGYPNKDTIIIIYEFEDGANFSGTTRKCFLPYTDEGLEVLALLRIAFERKLSFKVGTSITTGEKNTTIWNGIHHKTSVKGGPTNFGYPDNNYFTRVKNELAAFGISSETVKKDLKQMAKDFIREGVLKLNFAFDYISS